MRKKLGILLCMSLLLSSGLKAYAGGIEVINESVSENVRYKDSTFDYAVTKEYRTDDREQKYDFDGKYGDTVLMDTVYEVFDETSDTISVTRVYRDQMTKDNSLLEQSVTENGITYELSDVSWEEEPYMETVTAEVDYGLCVTQPTIEDYRYTTYTSDDTKQTLEVQIPFKKLEIGDYAWHDGFKAELEFKNLSGVFNLSGTDFYYDDSSLNLSEDDFAVLVDKLGYNTKQYILDHAQWKGKEYLKNGERYRKAVATGKTYAARYVAHYEGQVETGKKYTATALYKSEANTKYSVRAVGYYKADGGFVDVITFVTKHKGFSTGFIIIILAGIAAAGILLLKKKEEADSVVESEGDDT